MFTTTEKTNNTTGNTPAIFRKKSNVGFFPQTSLFTPSIQKQGDETKQEYPTSSGKFKVGAPQRPSIQHDNGFLDAYNEKTGTGDPKFKERAPGFSDYAKLAKWKLMLEGSEALRSDLVDANAAYRHFLEGNGADRWFNYERYVENDSSGATTLSGAISYAQKHTQAVCAPGKWTQITSGAFTTGQAGDFSFPYPATENWQKAIGGHNLWMSGLVYAKQNGKKISYTMALTIHVEDRYNFNPGMQDIKTGIPDSDNGIFEVTGLGKQYMNFSTLTRTVSWSSDAVSTPEVKDDDKSRNRKPADNRRLRNKI